VNVGSLSWTGIGVCVETVARVAGGVGVTDSSVVEAVTSMVCDGVGVTGSHVGKSTGVGVGLAGGGDVGFCRLRVGVADGTVCRLGPCPGAAHISGLAAVAAISTPKRMIQNLYLLLRTALSCPCFISIS
jgi:hypothetical protein